MPEEIAMKCLSNPKTSLSKGEQDQRDGERGCRREVFALQATNPVLIPNIPGSWSSNGSTCGAT